MDPDTRQFEDANGETWTVTRDTGLRHGASASGHFPSGGVRGLHFSNSKGDDRVLPRGLDDLPSREELQALSEATLRELLLLAMPHQ